MEDLKIPVLDWWVASLPFEGNEYSGDSYIVKPSDIGILVAVMDGLGHGEEAAEASRIAIETLTHTGSEDLFALVRNCHEALARTRGVVMSLASFNKNDKAMTWMGIGNVEGILVRADSETKPVRESLFRRGGVIGYQLPPLRSSVLAINPGDTLVFATDGIAADFCREVNTEDPLRQIADRIVSKYSKRTDDALALVARYMG